MRTYPFLSLAAALLAVGCQKDGPEAGLPAATQEGKNTFGCLVDGQLFVSTLPQGINGVHRDPLEASRYRTDILVSASGNGYVDLAIRNAFRSGTYPLSEIRSGSYASYRVSAGDYNTDAIHTGTVTLTRIDTGAKIAAGTFQFTGLNRSGKTVTVTDGRFDVRLK